MSFLIEWVTNIILFILLATVIDMLLPNSSLQKYTKMVTGLLLIAIILTPIFKLISNNFDATFASIPTFENSGGQNMKNLIETKKKEIQASDHAYIVEQMAVQLKKGVAEELMKKYGLEIANIELQTNDKSNQTFPDNLKKVSVLLKQKEGQVEAVEVVKPVEIDTRKPLSSNENTNTKQQKKLVAFLSQKWNVNEKNIDITIEGGKNQ